MNLLDPTVNQMRHEERLRQARVYHRLITAPRRNDELLAREAGGKRAGSRLRHLLPLFGA